MPKFQVLLILVTNALIMMGSMRIPSHRDQRRKMLAKLCSWKTTPSSFYLFIFFVYLAHRHQCKTLKWIGNTQCHMCKQLACSSLWPPRAVISNKVAQIPQSIVSRPHAIYCIEFKTGAKSQQLFLFDYKSNTSNRHGDHAGNGENTWEFFTWEQYKLIDQSVLYDITNCQKKKMCEKFTAQLQTKFVIHFTQGAGFQLHSIIMQRT